MADEQKSQKGLSAVVIAVLVALVAGGSAPWWLDLFQSEPQAAAPPGVTDGPESRPLEAPKTLLAREMGALEFNTNRQGHDLNTGDEVSRADDCAMLCAQEERCRAMTFVEHPGGGGGICWLKDGSTEPIPQPGMTSAAKVVTASN